MKYVRAMAMPRLALAAGLFVAAFGAPKADEAAAAGPPLFEIRLAPGGLDDEGNPTWLDVAATIEAPQAAAGAALLRTPVKFAGVAGVAYATTEIGVTDDAGPVPLTETVDDPDAGGFLFWRHWAPTRATQGDVELHYRAPIRMVIPRLGGGPPFDLRAQGGGLSGAANTFMIMPESSQPFTIRIHWDLDALAPGAIAVSSFGDGNTTGVGPVDRLVATFLMAGPLGRYAPDEPASGFSGYWIDEPRFDATALLQWSENAYEMIADFFADAHPPEFRVLMRPNPYQGGGGSALMNSYLLSFPESLDDGESLRETIAHETFHNWGPQISGAPGSTSWFSEGSTVFYTRELLLRSGLTTPSEFLESVNGTAAGYYTNSMNDLPNDRIAARFWEDTRVRTLPYARGSMYFADVDGKVRTASEGARSLDDLLKAFIALGKDGEPQTVDAWSDLVAAELGQPGRHDLEAMLAGELVVPGSDAFGPCFERRAVPLERFELGFSRETLVTEPRIVTELVRDSAAAHAGLRDGDELLRPVALEKVQQDPGQSLELEVRRDGKTMKIAYRPRGESVPGYKWQRKPGTADGKCRHSALTTR